MLSGENFLTACADGGGWWWPLRNVPSKGLAIVSSTKPARHCGLSLLNSDRYTQSDARVQNTEY